MVDANDYDYYYEEDYELEPDYENPVYYVEEDTNKVVEDNKYNNSNVFESYDEDDVKYISFIEVIKENIEKNTYEEKPIYMRKTLFSSDKIVKKVSSISKFVLVSPIELYYRMKWESFHKISHDEDKCTICLDSLYEISKESSLEDVMEINENLAYKFNVVMLDQCTDHFFHIECLSDMIGSNSFIKCPVCSKIYGILKGTQPDGTMHASVCSNMKCQGYENCDTIVINYSFPGGHNYTGTARTAYLPYNKDGLRILGLFKVCFDRRLIFTVGTSVTTGQSNTTVWAGIHHKTNITGGKI